MLLPRRRPAWIGATPVALVVAALLILAVALGTDVSVTRANAHAPATTTGSQPRGTTPSQAEATSRSQAQGTTRSHGQGTTAQSHGQGTTRSQGQRATAPKEPAPTFTAPQRTGSAAAAPRRPIPAAPVEPLDDPRPDFARMLRQQADTDRTWRAASAGFMQMEKITYRSPAGDLDIPAFVFQPLQAGPPHSRPAIVWVHENIRGHLYEHYIPYVRDATARGFVVIAPEYRGSIGYGKRFYDAIDYGGAEVADVTAAANVLRSRYEQVDPNRIGIIGWSHGGLITLLSIFRNPTTFRAAAALVPVTNLFHRLARKGVERQRRAIDPQNRFGGTPWERPEIYKERSPLFGVDRLQIPLLLHVAANDQDVNFDEAIQLVDALLARKPSLADIKIYPSPFGGHTFDRRVIPGTWNPQNTPDQRDSWQRVWAFFESRLGIDN